MNTSLLSLVTSRGVFRRRAWGSARKPQKTRSPAQLGVWDGVTSSAFPQVCFFVTWHILFCVKTQIPRSATAWTPRVGRFVEMPGNPHLFALLLWPWLGWDCPVAILISLAKKAAASWSSTKVPGPVPLPQTPDQESGRWPKDVVGTHSTGMWR